MRKVVFCHDLQGLLEDLPQLDSLVICGQKIVGCILSSTPLDLVYLLLYLQRLEIVELRLMRLKLGMKFVLAGLLLQEISM